MPIGIVDVLEVVEVEEQHSAGITETISGLDRALDLFTKAAAVDQPG